MSEQHGGGIPSHPDEPRIKDELKQFVEKEFGTHFKPARYGSRPVGDSGESLSRPSNPAPQNVQGESVVDAARALSARKRGEIALLAGESSPAAKELIDKMMKPAGKKEF